jgi:tetratricopeptide (TPR) repeat protein
MVDVRAKLPTSVGTLQRHHGRTRFPVLAAALLAAALLSPPSAGRAVAGPGDGGNVCPESGINPAWDNACYPPPFESATSLAVSGRWGEALALYRIGLLRTHIETERWEEALRLLQRMERYRDFPEGIDPREIRRSASEALERQAVALCRADLASDALSLSDLSIRFDPSRSEPFALRGYCRFRLGSAGLAEADYRKAIALRPGNIDAVGGLARLFNVQGRAKEATALWDRYLAGDPDNGDAWLRRGESLFLDRDIKGAVRDMEQACALGSEEGCRRVDELRAAAVAASAKKL